ncbi:MAG: hypothetical protein V8Q75_03490 [Bacilli bacterium]
MEGERISIVDNLIQAISILNKTDEYMESLFNRLSDCDSLTSDYEHFIENTPIEEVDLRKLYKVMQNNFIERRIVKNDITLRDNYKNLTARLNNSTNREFLIQNMKTVQSKIGLKYHNRILSVEDIEQLKDFQIVEKKKRGRPKKVKEGI